MGLALPTRIKKVVPGHLSRALNVLGRQRRKDTLEQEDRVFKGREV